MNNNHRTISNSTDNGNGLGKLISNLQKEDARNLNMYKRFQIIYMMFALMYGFFFVLNPFWDLGIADRVSGVCYVLAFLILFFVFRKYNFEFRNIDYALPTTLMLKEAVKRYAFVKARRIGVLIVPLILVDVAISLTIMKRYPDTDPWKVIEIIQTVYVLFILISFIIGVAIWRHKQKPLRDEALRLLVELEQ